MSVTRSQHLVPQAESGLRAGQYDGPAIGRRAKSLPLHRRVSRIGSTPFWRSRRAVFYGTRVALVGHCRTMASTAPGITVTVYGVTGMQQAVPVAINCRLRWRS